MSAKHKAEREDHRRECWEGDEVHSEGGEGEGGEGGGGLSLGSFI